MSKGNYNWIKNFEIVNRKARFDYFVEETYTAGIILQGNEVKSLRVGTGSLVDSFCYIHNNEIFVKGFNITKMFGNAFSKGDGTRDKKLLLNKKEIISLFKATQNPGYTIIPLKAYMDNRGYVKLLIGLCKGKHDYDKRETIKERDTKRELQSIIKNY